MTVPVRTRRNTTSSPLPDLRASLPFGQNSAQSGRNDSIRTTYRIFTQVNWPTPRVHSKTDGRVMKNGGVLLLPISCLSFRNVGYGSLAASCALKISDTQ